MGTHLLQAVGPVALVSLLLSEGLSKAVPGAELNTNPNSPADPDVQAVYNRAAIQVGAGLHGCSRRLANAMPHAWIDKGMLHGRTQGGTRRETKDGIRNEISHDT